MIVALGVVISRELKKTFRQKSRLLASLVRPLIWLFVIGGGIGSILPSDSNSNYQQAIVPGILGMTLLFGSMLSALTTVYDKESGVMRMFIISPMSSYGIILSKLVSSTIAGIVQVVGLLILLFTLSIVDVGQIHIPLFIFGLICTALTCSTIGLITAVLSKSLDNFAAIMNFVIFPVFFLSGALYPIDNLPPALHWVAVANPFSYGVDLIKHSIISVSVTPDFGKVPDIIVLFVFTVIGVTFSSWRFSQESTSAALVSILSKGRKS